MTAAPWPPPVALLPHGARACCIDTIETFTPGTGVRAHWRVHSGSTLYDAGRKGVPAWAGIEIMAQCAGLYLGLARAGSGDARAPERGYLVGVRRFHAHREVFADAAELVIEAACEAADLSAGELGTFECRILCGGHEGARARIMLWCAAEFLEEA